MSWGKPRLWLPIGRGYSVRFLVAWFDLWVGAVREARGGRLYVLPDPVVGIVI